MNGEKIDLSVVIGTRNRQVSLQRLLVSLMRCKVPEGKRIEVIVADNGSQDGTSDMVRQLSAQAPWPLDCISEPRKGVCRARNHGIRTARAPIVAFTDDDCTVSEDWIAQILACFEQHPEVAGLFGRVLPMDGRTIDASTIAVKPDTQAKVYRFPDPPFIGHGNNMVFRRQALLDVGGFDICFGPGGKLIAAEELELGYRLLKADKQLRYEPQVLLLHAQREEASALIQTHKTNAIGLGSCFGRHGFRGDLHALKVAWWWWRTTWQSWRTAVRQGDAPVIEIKQLYLRWFLVGAFKGIADAPRPFRSAFKENEGPAA